MLIPNANHGVPGHTLRHSQAPIFVIPAEAGIQAPILVGVVLSEAKDLNEFQVGMGPEEILQRAVRAVRASAPALS